MPDNALENDSEFAKKYGKLFAMMQNTDISDCPSSEILAQFWGNTLRDDSYNRIERHIDQCPYCLSAIEALNKSTIHSDDLEADWQEISQAINTAFYDQFEQRRHTQSNAIESQTAISDTLQKKWHHFCDRIFGTRGLVYAVAFTTCMICIIYTTAYINRPAYFNLCEVRFDRQGTFRSGSSGFEAFDAGLQFLQKQDYVAAQKKLKIAAKNHPKNYQVQFHLGLSYVLGARKSLPGLSYAFDKGTLQIGMVHLERALGLAGSNAFYQEDCLWYLGKAQLMMGELNAAREKFSEIVALRQVNLERQVDAKQILAALAKF